MLVSPRKLRVSYRLWTAFCGKLFRFRPPHSQEKGAGCDWSGENGDLARKYGGFLKWGYPQIIHFNGIVSYKLAICGYPHSWKLPYLKQHHNSVFPSRLSRQLWVTIRGKGQGTSDPTVGNRKVSPLWLGKRSSTPSKVDKY